MPKVVYGERRISKALHFREQNSQTQLDEKRSLGTGLYVGRYPVLQTIVDSFRDPDIYDSLFDVPPMTVVIWAIFVTSMCTLGALILGYPAKLAWDGRTRASVILIAATAFWIVFMLSV